MTTTNSFANYGNVFASKVIGSLLSNKQFFTNISRNLLPEYFNNDSQIWVVEFAKRYYDKYHTIPTIEAVNSEIQKINDGVLKIAVIEELKKAYNHADGSDAPYIQDEFSMFCQNQKMKTTIRKCSGLLEVGDFEEIKRIVNEAAKSLKESSIGHNYSTDIETRYREEDRGVIAYPWKCLNDITQGGFGKGELILIFGPPKGGKSWIAIDIAGNAYRNGFNVVYYTLELREGYVGRRIDSYLTGIPVDQITKHREKVEKLIGGLKGKLIVKEFPAGRTSLGDIEAHLDQLESEEEFKPDLIVIDYLDLLNNRVIRKEKREDLDDIYTDSRGMAQERQIPIISPSQVNRAGAQDEVIEADKISGSYGKIMIADFALSLSRKRKDRLEGTARIHIMGNRYGVDGITFLSNFDSSNGQIDIYEAVIDDGDKKCNIDKGQLSKEELAKFL